MNEQARNMNKPLHITHESLKSILHYDEATGVFTWLVDRGTRLRAGSRAGAIDASGYRRIGVNKVYYYAHRLAWMYVHGVMPEQCIDHINGNRADNRLLNLRHVSAQQNCFNLHVTKAPSGLLGVRWNARKGRWVAKIQINGQRKQLGSFDSPAEAHEAYLSAKKTIHAIAPA